MCGVENAHIGTISSQWNDETEKPRIRAIKAALSESGSSYSQAHIEVLHKGVVHYCYPAEVCLAVLEYYAFDAGQNLQPKARKNFRLLAGSKLSDMIYSQVGYDPDGNITEPLRKWFERIELNHQSAGDGYFCIFNESHTVIYELIMAGAPIGESMVPDISMGTHWARYWEEFNLDERFGEKKSFPIVIQMITRKRSQILKVPIATLSMHLENFAGGLMMFTSARKNSPSTSKDKRKYHHL